MRRKSSMKMPQGYCLLKSSWLDWMHQNYKSKTACTSHYIYIVILTFQVPIVVKKVADWKIYKVYQITNNSLSNNSHRNQRLVPFSVRMENRLDEKPTQIHLDEFKVFITHLKPLWEAACPCPWPRKREEIFSNKKIL